MTMKRRDALKAIGRLSAAAGIAAYLPGCGDNGSGAAPPADSGGGGSDSGGSNDAVGITTYVYMMMENRSYDHFFGSRMGVEGKQGDGLDLTGKTMFNKDINGKIVYPFNPVGVAECDIDPPHSWDALHASWNMGQNDGFLAQHQMQYMDATLQQPMQYLTRHDCPVSYALADAYASTDRWFCSVMGPTWPNRFYWHTGQSGGIMSNELPGSNLPWDSVYNRLHDKNISWGYYFGSIPVVSTITNFDTTKNVFFFDQFMADAKAGKLPQVVYIDPIFDGNDDHPPIHPINGQELIYTVYTALANSPQWKNCLLLITYDENGGFYDHVSPPTTVDDRAAQGFGQMGFRVPTMVIGPYVKNNFVSSTVRDHCSALRELQTAFDLDPLNQRVTAANDLSEFIDMDRLQAGQWNPPITLPTVDPTDPQWQANDPSCVGSLSVAPEPHPIIQFADKYPHLIPPGMDRRKDQAQCRQAIRDFVSEQKAKDKAKIG